MRDQNGNFILTFAPKQQIQAILEAQELQVLLEEGKQTFLESKVHSSSPILTIKANTPLYNAQGTADDVIEINGKIQRITNKDLWQRVTGEVLPSMCENQNCAMTSPFNIVGAHMVLKPDKVHARVGDTFYLVPICNGCNHTTQPIVFNHDVKAVVLVAQ